VVVAAVERRAAWAGGDAGLVQDRHRLVLSQGALERPQLGVDVAERAQLGDHERVVALSEAVQIEDQPAEVAIGELTRLAQEARAPARSATRAEAGLPGIADDAQRAGRERPQESW
jgi:predicted dinucleotide-utilizing enzyme